MWSAGWSLQLDGRVFVIEVFGKVRCQGGEHPECNVDILETNTIQAWSLRALACLPYASADKKSRYVG